MHHEQIRKLVSAGFLSCGLFVGNSANAALIEWGDPADAVSATDVLNTGDFFAAKSYRATETDNTYTVNGVTFAGASETRITIEGSSGLAFIATPPSTGNSDYNAILFLGAFSTLDDRDIITISGLSVGQEYRVQLFVPVWDIDWPTEFYTSVGRGGETMVQVGNSRNVARHVSGVFLADSASQSIFYQGFEGTNYGIVSAVSVFAIPEPSAYAAVAGLAAIGMAMGRRRRRE